jgi:hypothetical protein
VKEEAASGTTVDMFAAQKHDSMYDTFCVIVCWTRYYIIARLAFMVLVYRLSHHRAIDYADKY